MKLSDNNYVYGNSDARVGYFNAARKKFLKIAYHNILYIILMLKKIIIMVTIL